VTKRTEISATSNDGKAVIAMSEPYVATAKVESVSDLLFHRWNCDAIAEKAKAAKGSKAKKEDDLPSYVYRNDDGHLAIPGEYFRQAILGAARFKQDPRSPRKSAVDLVKAAVFSLADLCSLGVKDWDFEDRRRVQVQRAGVTRVRPAMKAGWRCEVQFQVNLPEYVSPAFLHELLNDAGRLIGVGDFRPTFGRFRVVTFD